ncbi:hypothetical protein [Nonomuraea sp. 3-1Str]|nr:hypothetical protein [Nonomuraea sp. 3-1Str]
MTSNSSRVTRQQWPQGANGGQSQPVYTCSCGAQSTSPINHNHR